MKDHRVCVPILACMILSSLLPTVLVAQGWTRFRGPNGSGVSQSSIPATWTEADLAWRTPLPGIGHSSPVVWKDHVYVMSADPETARQFVVAIDVENGDIAWQREFSTSPYDIHLHNSFASSSPSVDSDHVYVAWSTPSEATLTALDHRGETIWQQALGPFASSHGFGGSAILYQDLVILSLLEQKPDRQGPRTETSRVVALDRMTGEQRWRRTRSSEVASYSTPCIYRPPVGKDELIGCSTADGIFSLDPLTGEQNWQIEVFDMRTVSSPIVADGLILGTTGSGGGGNYAVAIAPGREPQTVYTVREQAPYVPTPVAKDGLVFLWSDKGIVSCIRAVDGDVIWRKRVGGNYSGSPVIAGEHLYCIDDAGDVVVLAASDQYRLLGKNPLGEASRSTPAVANGRMYLRTYSHLISVGGGS